MNTRKTGKSKRAGSLQRAARDHALRATMIAVRTKAALTQQEVAERMDRAQSYVAKMEAGKRQIKVLDLWAFADVMGIDVRRLLSRVIAKAGPSRFGARRYRNR